MPNFSPDFATLTTSTRRVPYFLLIHFDGSRLPLIPFVDIPVLPDFASQRVQQRVEALVEPGPVFLNGRQGRGRQQPDLLLFRHLPANQLRVVRHAG